MPAGRFGRDSRGRPQGPWRLRFSYSGGERARLLPFEIEAGALRLAFEGALRRLEDLLLQRLRLLRGVPGADLLLQLVAQRLEVVHARRADGVLDQVLPEFARFHG